MWMTLQSYFNKYYFCKDVDFFGYRRCYGASQKLAAS